MRPSTFVILDELPLTPNGKVDRRRLPAPAWSRATSGTQDAPLQAIESALIDIWSEVLKVEQVGTHDNFFDLGGHSLLATQVCSRVRKIFGVELPLRSLFETPTPAGLGNRLAAALRAGEASDVPLVRVTRDESLPLSFAQQRLWFIDRLEGGQSAFYNITIALRLRGPLEVDALDQALNAIVQRHEVLRTRFVEIDGEPIQVIEDDVEIVLRREDLGGLPEAVREAAIRQLATAETQSPFDLAAGPLLRALLARMGADDHVVLLTMHHIVSDGWSRGVFVREMAALYSDFAGGGNGEGALEELPVQYADFAVWQRSQLQGELLNSQLDYWRRQLAGASQLLELPADKPRPAVQSYRGATYARRLPKSLTSSLKELNRRESTTMFMTLLAAFQTLLYRYTGQEDIVVGSPIANRTLPETETLIGFFANTLVFRTLFSGDPSFKELLGRVREVALGAYAHQDVPFEMLIEELQPERSLSYAPLFQVMFVWNNAPRESIELPGLNIGPLGMDHTSAKFDLTLTTFETEQGITSVFEYNTDLFEEPSIARMAQHFENLLLAVTTTPEQRISTVVLLDAEEQRRLVQAGRGEATDYQRTACVHELFEQQAARTPNAVALIYEEQKLTYRELDRRSNRLAARLQALGIGPERVVGLLGERSPEMMVGLLAVLKAGGAYLPLDPATPPARLSFILKDASVALVLLRRRFRACLASVDQPPLSVEIDDCGALASDKDDDTEVKSGVGPDNLVYVIYTSGSTGQPKGVLITHRGVVNYLSWATIAYRAGEGEGAAVQSPLTFDLTVTSLFAALLAGRPVHLLPEPGVETLATALRSNSDFTLVKLTPSHLETLAQQLAPNEADGRTRAFVIGGEPLLGDVLHFWQRHAPATRLINEYGPTETVVGCCVYEVPEGQETSGRVPIGRPVANTQLCILDRALQPVPMGVRGELYVGGEGVGRGYLNRPDLTAERFVPDPFSTGTGMRLYRTGDFVRYLPDSNIEYLGRTDHQVKIRGYRIELGEVEAALVSHTAIRECSVVSAKDGTGKEQLVAYVVAQEGPEISADELRRALTDRLPAYMIPAVFVFLDELPRTANGKVDRRALPAYEHASAAVGHLIAPRVGLESQLAQIWEDLLNVRPIGINQSFFALGGHSMLAVRLMARIRQQLGHDLPISVLFQAETIEKLAVFIAQQSGGAVRWSPLVPIQPRGSLVPFFCVHAVGGNVNNFYHLARELGTERPFYGLQAPQLHEVEEDETTIERIAARYLEAIASVAGDKPHLLGGYSFGSYVAYEMARQLEARGQRVTLLAIIDSYSPLFLNRLTHTHSVADLLVSLAWVTAREKGQQLLLSVDDLKTLDFDDQLRFFLDRMHESGLAPPELDFEILRRLVKGFSVRRRAAYTYTPPKYGGRITLFRCAETDALMAQRLAGVGLDPQEPTFGWRELSDDVEVHTVPGYHDVICNEPYVQGLAATLRECLDRASTEA
jgi:amino acid adenylation domain-containing protein